MKPPVEFTGKSLGFIEGGTVAEDVIESMEQDGLPYQVAFENVVATRFDRDLDGSFRRLVDRPGFSKGFHATLQSAQNPRVREG